METPEEEGGPRGLLSGCTTPGYGHPFFGLRGPGWLWIPWVRAATSRSNICMWFSVLIMVFGSRRSPTYGDRDFLANVMSLRGDGHGRHSGRQSCVPSYRVNISASLVMTISLMWWTWRGVAPLVPWSGRTHHQTRRTLCSGPWSLGLDSNQRPAVYETAALPAELPRPGAWEWDCTTDLLDMSQLLYY